MTGRPKHGTPWTGDPIRIALYTLIATAVGIAVTVLVMLVGPIWNARVTAQDTQPGGTVGQTGTARPGPATSDRNEPGTPGASSTRSPGTCVTQDGQGVTCGTADSWMIVKAQPCEYGAVRAAIGVDEQVNLDLEIRTQGNECLVRPGAQASTAGATTAALARLAGGRPDSALVVCFTRPDLTQSVSCASPHRFEAIGDWRPKPPDLRPDACIEAARGYTSRAVNTPNEPLLVKTVPGTLEGQPVFRCVISSPDPLRHSVWRWGDQEL